MDVSVRDLFVIFLSSLVLVFKRFIAVHGVLFCAAIWRNQP